MDQEFRDDIISRLTRIETLALATNGSVKDHERRVRYLERVAWGLGGAIALLTTMVTMVFIFLEMHR